MAGLMVAITTASSGLTPSSTATRTIWLMCPSSTMKSGSRSSVQNMHWLVPYCFTSGSRSFRLRAPVASRSMTHIPRRLFSRASSNVVDSWSERMPAAR